MSNIFAFGRTTQHTSSAMITTVNDIFTASGVRQSTPSSVEIVTTNPTFAGITGLAAQLNGSLLASWAAGTGPTAPLIYDVYIQLSTATGLFVDGNKLPSVFTTAVYIFQLPGGALLVKDSTYFVGVRARDPLGNLSTTTVSMSAVSLGVQPSRVLAPGDIPAIVAAVWDELSASYVGAGKFGTHINTLLTRLSATRATNLDFLDAAMTSRASQTSVDAIQNNTRFVGVVPSVLVLPTSGSKSYKFYATLFDTAGSPEDPDTNLLNYRIETTGGSIIVATTAMTRTGVGQYETAYSVSSADPERALVVFFEYTENSVSFRQSRVTEVQEFESKLDTLLTRLSAPRAANLDNLDSPISTVPALTWDIPLASHQSAGSVGKALNDAAYSGSTLTPGDWSNIADTVWGKIRSPLNVFGTFGEALQGVFSVSRAAKIDNLDVLLSSRESEADASARANNDAAAHAATQSLIGTGNSGIATINAKLGTPVTTIAGDIAEVEAQTDAIEVKTAPLPTDPASQSATNIQIGLAVAAATAANVTATAIKAKTDNLPADPASQTAVNARPTNPLLDNDSRLATLDATISSRATPGNLSTLATTAQLSASQTAIQTDIAGVSTALATKPSTAQLAAAVAPLALQATLLSVGGIAASIQADALTADDVWTYSIRALTVPVDVTLDTSGLATSVQVTAAKDATVAALNQWTPVITAAIYTPTDEIEVLAWLNKNGQRSTSASNSTIWVYDGDNNLAFTSGPDTSDTPQGVFRFTRANASTVLTSGKTYTVKVEITQDSVTYTGNQSFTVF